ncbi:MAG TPA: poly-gamma-glutamate hydrolase family protein [Anaerovoracaceae bacterium]|nr:poly-gamma-glutamate hydrolase family protein [Anaerovoracaceae bacterium]
MKKKLAKILALAMMFTLAVGTSAFAFTTGYHSFADLAAAEDPAGYGITADDRGQSTTILAIHGGGIEKGTSELVEALKGKGKYNTYLFEGLKAADNGSLFIRAINFDEPEAVSLVQDSAYTVSIIGAAGGGETTYIGGQNKMLAELIKLHLATKGYNVETLSIPDQIAGVMDSNIVNQNQLFNGYELGGVQIAISEGLRDKLAADPDALNAYSGAVNAALSKSWPAIANQLKKITKGNGNGFFGKYSLMKPSLNKEVDKILKKGADTPEELVQNAES